MPMLSATLAGNCASSAEACFIFHKLASRNFESVDRRTTAEMLEFPATDRQQFIGSRNWLSLDCSPDGTAISANRYSEGELETPYKFDSRSPGDPLK